MIYKIVLLCLILLINPVFGQENLPADTLTAIPDSVQSGNIIMPDDTLGTVKGVDSVVTYSCRDSIIYVVSERTMTMFEKGEIAYRQMNLKADRISLNWSNATLSAEGVPDMSDTARKFRGTPVMRDGAEEYKGFTLAYNFETKKGKINLGTTEMDQGFYYGQDIKKVDKEILFVSSGRYTTCDKPQSHYYFASPTMKVIMGDKVIAEPVYLYIADVPVFALPFGVFPNKGGRRSGIIPPKYGEDYNRGRFLRDFGYYWAISDYMDFSLRGDWFSKGGWTAYTDYRYALQYKFSGSLSGEYRKVIFGEKSDPQRREDNSYRVNINHNQEFDPTTQLSVNFTFASNNSYLNTNDLRQAQEQSIISNATLMKRWEDSPNSISLNIGRQQSLRDGRIDEILPSINFYHSQSYPFRRRKSTSSETSMSWYEMISMRYNLSANNQRSKYSTPIYGVKVNLDGRDTIKTIEQIRRDQKQMLTQGIGFSIAPKIGYITISPFFNYNDNRIFNNNQIPSRSEEDSSLIFVRDRSVKRSGEFSSGVSTSTRFFGIVQPMILGVMAIRHAVEPSIGFTYNKRIIGEGLLKRQMFLNMNVGNNFEMKTVPRSEKEEPQKIQLINIGAGISYNFSADSLNFSPLRLGFRTGISNILNIGGDASFNLYRLVQTGPNEFRTFNQFLLKEEGRLARLENFRISISTSLSGEQRKSKSEQESKSPALVSQQPRQTMAQLPLEDEPDFSIPWSLSMSFDFFESKVPPYRSRSTTMNGGLDFNLTEKWKFSFRGGYDLRNKEIVFPEVTISRDLHCWIMNFSWVPFGYYRRYQFEIRVKASQLQDVKVTKSGSERGIY